MPYFALPPDLDYVDFVPFCDVAWIVVRVVVSVNYGSNLVGLGFGRRVIESVLAYLLGQQKVSHLDLDLFDAQRNVDTLLDEG